MANLGDLVARIVAFIRAGYPQGVPPIDYIPLLALLRRRLTDDEVTDVAIQLATSGELNVDVADIGAAITRFTDQLPSRMISTGCSDGWKRSAGPPIRSDAKANDVQLVAWRVPDGRVEEPRWPTNREPKSRS